jgi:uncharacterized protein VirK/YbjX
MSALRAFFSSDPLFEKFSTTYPIVYEQLTRQVFYRDSTPTERFTLITTHLRFCTAAFTQEVFNRICYGGGYVVWRGEYTNETLSFKIIFDGGMKKEGLMGVAFDIGESRIYQINFWINVTTSGAKILSIGALQGQDGELPLLSALTKHFHGYRPKNLILRVVRLIAIQLKLDRIFAVSDHGHYTRNHLRIDRQLKTSLTDFWLEAGGVQSDDPRFFELGKNEPQKNIEDIKSSKRSLYRKRFAMLEEFDAEMRDSLHKGVISNSGNAGLSCENQG